MKLDEKTISFELMEKPVFKVPCLASHVIFYLHFNIFLWLKLTYFEHYHHHYKFHLIMIRHYVCSLSIPVFGIGVSRSLQFLAIPSLGMCNVLMFSTTYTSRYCYLLRHSIYHLLLEFYFHQALVWSLCFRYGPWNLDSKLVYYEEF